MSQVSETVGDSADRNYKQSSLASVMEIHCGLWTVCLLLIVLCTVTRARGEGTECGGGGGGGGGRKREKKER